MNLSSFPILDVPLITSLLFYHLMHPSNCCKYILQQQHSENFPSKANLIEVKPMQTPINVIALGKNHSSFFI